MQLGAAPALQGAFSPSAQDRQKTGCFLWFYTQEDVQGLGCISANLKHICLAVACVEVIC